MVKSGFHVWLIISLKLGPNCLNNACELASRSVGRTILLLNSGARTELNIYESRGWQLIGEL